MAKVHLRASVLFIAFTSAAWAEVNIPTECRIKNLPPGRCGWCALETLARHHHIEALYGLTKAHATLSSPEHLEEVLDQAGVAYRIQYPGNYSKAILRNAVKKGLGAAVGVRGDYNGHGPHILTLIDFDKDRVKVIDCNDKDRRTREISMDDFLYWWDGFAIVLEAAPQADAAAAKSASASRP
jgi:hypothetical protein